MKVLAIGLLFAGAAVSAFAAYAVAAPEIDGSSTVTAAMLLSGGLLVMRARRKK